MKMGDFDMVKKQGTVYVCQECGYESPKWQGQCICGAWNSMVEEKMIPDMPSKGIGVGAKGKKLPKARKLEDIGEHTNIRIDSFSTRPTRTTRSTASVDRKSVV